MIELEATLGVSSSFLESHTRKRTPEVKGCILVAEPAFQPHSSTPRHLLMPSAHWNLHDAFLWAKTLEASWKVVLVSAHVLPCQSENCVSWGQKSCSPIQGKKMDLWSQLLGELIKGIPLLGLRTQLLQEDWNGKHSLLASDLIL